MRIETVAMYPFTPLLLSPQYNPLPNNPSLLHSIPLLSPPSPSNPSSSFSFTFDPSSRGDGDMFEEVVQSCYGLFLCSCGDDGGIIDLTLFYVFNPTTKKSYPLPPPPPLTPPSPSLSMFTKVNLAFDPSRSPYYKVLLVRKAERGTSFFRIDIYCSKTGGWRGCGDHVEWRNIEVFCKGVYVNGALYWASKRDGFLSFDVERECFQAMPALPGFRNGGSTVRYLGEWSGKLYLVDSLVLEFDVFEMGRDNSGWVLRYQVNLAPSFGTVPSFTYLQRDLGVEKTYVSLISVVSEGGINGGDLCLVLHVPGKILSYNLESGGIKVIRDEFLGNVESTIPALVKDFRGYQVVESLACV